MFPFFPTGFCEFYHSSVFISVIHQELYFSYHLCLGMQCTMNYYQKKKSLNVISSNFTGKNSHWQPMSKNVASVSDVMIKGDNSLMEM